MSKNSVPMPNKCSLILASGSPRRADILRSLGLPFTIKIPNVDESRLQNESPFEMVERLARLKCRSVIGPMPVLAGDTIACLGGEILGKPADKSDAKRMLKRLSGRSHEVLTGFCLKREGELHSEVVRSVVTFLPLSDACIEAYLESDECLDKAGAYAIQGEAAPFVSELEGSLTNVIGLPMREVWAAMLKFRVFS